MRHAGQVLPVDLEDFIALLESTVIEGRSAIEYSFHVKSHRTASRIHAADDGKSKAATRWLYDGPNKNI